MGMYWKLLGKEAGDFRFEHHKGDKQFFSRIIRNAMAQIPQIGSIFAPDCTGFTNQIVMDSQGGVAWSKIFVTTKDPADGVITKVPRRAIAMFTADCPIVAVFSPDHNNQPSRLAVLHAGFRCLIREQLKEPSIIEVLFQAGVFEPSAVQVFYGFGIGSCCYGAEHIPEVSGYSTRILPISRAIRGPRKGQQSLDLYAIIKHQLLKAGVKQGQIKRDTSCISCSGDYHSNCRDGPNAGRNCALVWFE